MSKKVKRHMIALYVDKTPDENSRDWVRLCKSTALTIAMNPETEDVYYIADEGQTTELNSYHPTIEQPLKMIKGEEDFDYFFDFYFDQKVGEDAKTNALVVYIFDETEEGGESYFRAWQTEASIVINELNAVDSELNFNVNFAGTTDKGYATISDGVPTYVDTIPEDESES